MNNNNKKPKAVIEPIIISEDEREKLNTLLNSVVSKGTKRRGIIQTVGGVCAICGQIPTHNLIYKLEGATLIERYCDKCLPK